jgi:UDP-N-acetylmuramoyl-tripeptide--D-alanyl-D-alanine ligase
MTDRLRRLLDSYLQACARLVLSRHKPLIVGITGTAGKTTTKEMLASILRDPDVQTRFGQAVVTSGNLNDNSGVPLTILGFSDFIGGRLKPFLMYPYVALRAVRLALRKAYPRLLVLEFGTHKHGNLHELVRLARPNIGVVTNVGPAHLETLGSLQGVADEKAALVISPPKDGAVILGSGHAFIDYFAKLAKAPVTVVEGVGYELNRNIAREVGRRLGIAEDVIERGLADFAPPARRLERSELRELTLIDDSHNANPISMRFALDTLLATAASSRKVAVLGSMAELAEESAMEHAAIGQAARAAADVVVGVGENAKAYQPDYWFKDADACCDELMSHLEPGDLVLVKGSGSSGVPQVADFLISQAS